jgi:two-component system sensor histidine kinase DesK
VTNVLRHSGASRCSLVVGRDEAMAWIEVGDNGRGGKGGAGWGLQGLRERANSLGGIATWESPAGGGFRIKVTVPAESQLEEAAEP